MVFTQKTLIVLKPSGFTAILERWFSYNSLSFILLFTDGFIVKIHLIGILVHIPSGVRGIALFYFSLKFSFICNYSHGYLFLGSQQVTQAIMETPLKQW